VTGQVLALCGPTASGKTAISLELADCLDLEIVVCDSMQVYRGLDVGTAKPSVREQAGVPHHCLDLVDPSCEFCAVDYQRVARAAIDDIHRRAKTPLLVGGVGLYLRAALDDLVFSSPPDPVRRKQLEACSPAELVRVLQETDPVRAARVDLANPRRVLRAVEQALDGLPSALDQAWLERSSLYPLALAVVAPSEREELRTRVDARVDAMMAAGWLEEVQHLAATFPVFSRTARGAIGYAELQQVLEGQLPLDSAIDRTKARTRKYARRQLGWFRGEPRAVWFRGQPEELTAPVQKFFQEALHSSEQLL